MLSSLERSRRSYFFMLSYFRTKSSTSSRSRAMCACLRPISLSVDSSCVFSVSRAVGWYIGGLDGFLFALIAFVITDYITGVLCAIEDRQLSSKVGFKGIARKVLMFTLVGIVDIFDTAVLKDDSAIRTAVIFFYLSNYGISILENAAYLGLPIPKALKNMLEAINEDKDESE